MSIAQLHRKVKLLQISFPIKQPNWSAENWPAKRPARIDQQNDWTAELIDLYLPCEMPYVVNWELNLYTKEKKNICRDSGVFFVHCLHVVQQKQPAPVIRLSKSLHFTITYKAICNKFQWKISAHLPHQIESDIFRSFQT